MKVEGYDIKEKMLMERRKWILDQQAEFGKPPADFEKFYERMNEDPSATPEGEETAAAGKKGKDAGKKGKGGDDAEEKEDKLTKIGPTELTGKFDIFYDEYLEKWASRDEVKNYD
jgi:hypothetical protein